VFQLLIAFVRILPDMLTFFCVVHQHFSVRTPLRGPMVMRYAQSPRT
jgi:hypothetical protein